MKTIRIALALITLSLFAAACQPANVEPKRGADDVYMPNLKGKERG